MTAQDCAAPTRADPAQLIAARNAEIARLTAEGWTARQTGDHLGLSEGRVNQLRAQLGLTAECSAPPPRCRLGRVAISEAAAREALRRMGLSPADYRDPKHGSDRVAEARMLAAMIALGVA
jgi:hypothetical protein